MIDMKDFLEVVTYAYEAASEVANSSFVTALFGAGAGAWAAYALGKRGKDFDDEVQEIRSCNHGITLAAAICNTAINLKTQHISPLKSSHDQHRKHHEAHRKSVKNGSPLEKTFEFQADYKKLPPLDVEWQTQQAVCSRISLSAKAMRKTFALSQSAKEFDLLISAHNDHVEKSKLAGQRSDVKAAADYFGTEINGEVDESYPDLVAGLAKKLDDCIWFANELNKELIARARVLRGNDKKLPEIYDLSFPTGEIPSNKNYETYL